MRTSGSVRSSGFTLIELLIVMVVIGLLMALLLPAIGGAMRSARNAAVSTEINQMAQALADFKSKTGSYPPSRILLSERGTYTLDMTTTSYATGIVDITDGQLAQRSVSWLRRVWPRLVLSTGTVANPPANPTVPGPLGFLDWNNNGKVDPPYVLTGDECLVFFLGGIPSTVVTAGKAGIGLNGFNRDPTNPSLAPIVTVGATTYTFNSRTSPLLEFKASRLVDLDGDGMPSYLDSLGTNRPFYFFSSYGGGAYDPSDCDDPTEADDAGTAPIGLKFRVPFPVAGGGTVATSAAPNPYTVSSTVPASGTVLWHAANTFQIISSGYDSLYGIGGQYVQGAPQALPIDAANTLPAGSGQQLRAREADDLTNFSTGKLD